MRKYVCLIVVMLGASVGGCSADGDHPFATVEDVRGLNDLNPLEFTPEALVDQASVVVTGTIAGVVDGHSVSELDPSMDGQELRDYTAVIEITVDSTIKRPDGEASDRVYVSIPRGVAIVEADGRPVQGSGEGYTVTSVDEIAQALPRGTRAVVAASPVDFAKLDAAKRFNRSESGVRSVPLDGMHPQAFSVEQADGMRGWESMTFDE